MTVRRAAQPSAKPREPRDPTSVRWRSARKALHSAPSDAGGASGTSGLSERKRSACPLRTVLCGARPDRAPQSDHGADQRAARAPMRAHHVLTGEDLGVCITGALQQVAQRRQRVRDRCRHRACLTTCVPAPDEPRQAVDRRQCTGGLDGGHDGGRCRRGVRRAAARRSAARFTAAPQRARGHVGRRAHAWRHRQVQDSGSVARKSRRAWPRSVGRATEAAPRAAAAAAPPEGESRSLGAAADIASQALKKVMEACAPGASLLAICTASGAVALQAASAAFAHSARRGAQTPSSPKAAARSSPRRSRERLLTAAWRSPRASGARSQARSCRSHSHVSFAASTTSPATSVPVTAT
jgi:hypothetical protein